MTAPVHVSEAGSAGSSPETDPADLPGYPIARECPYRPSSGTFLLREPGPLSKVRLYDGRTAWLVTGAEEARAVLAHRQTSQSSHHPNWPVLNEELTRMRGTREMAKEEEGGFAAALFGVDAPEHTRQRKILVPRFTLRKVAPMRPEIQRIVDQRLDAMLEQGPPADLMTSFASPVPLTVVCAHLGIPYDDRDSFEAQARDLFVPERADQAMEELTGYLEGLIQAKETRPGNGLLDELIADHVSRGELSHSELGGFALAILVAGTVTSTNLIGLGTLALLDNPGQYTALSNDPDLATDVVEELLRHISLVEQFARVATGDIEIAGNHIRAGEAILISSAGANLDPNVTTHPGVLDVRRPPSHHLAFGYGVHHCLGQNLARLELEIVFRTLAERVPTLRPTLPTDQIPTYNDGTVQRLTAFPVTW